jgi:hypothetical protein
MRLAYATVKFSVNNGKSLPVTVPTVARVHWHDLAAIADPNVRVKTVHRANDNDTLTAALRQRQVSPACTRETARQTSRVLADAGLSRA